MELIIKYAVTTNDPKREGSFTRICDSADKALACYYLEVSRLIENGYGHIFTETRPKAGISSRKAEWTDGASIVISIVM